MTVTVLAPYLKQRFVDGNGNPLYLGTVSTYVAGTSTPIATYKDSTGGPTNTNPIVLNARGECDIWLQPNVAYKFMVADANGNLIWTEDNVVNSQLITLYGGVDTGSANAYVLNFVASFTAYTDGVIVYFTPANTNTGGSTININGLGVIQIQNPDGSQLLAGEIVANQPAQILIKSDVAQLITAATSLYGTFTPSYSGFSTPPTGNVAYRKTGTQVTLILPATTGVSNLNAFIMNGIPALLLPVSTPNVRAVPVVGLIDNGAGVAGGMAFITAGTGSVQFFKDGAQTAWTPSGAKGFMTVVNPTLTYPI